MGLQWVRLDTAFTQNPKILSLIQDKKWQSIVVYTAALGYSGQHGTDGFIPNSALPFIHSTKKNASDLVSVGLFVGCPGGYDINDWKEFQPSNDESEVRRKKAKAAAETRWRRTREAKGEAV